LAAGPPAYAGTAPTPCEGVPHALARLLRQVSEVDPLVGPCGGRTMKILAVMERPARIRKTIARWGLRTPRPAFGRHSTGTRARALTRPPEWSPQPCLDDLPILDPMLG
jgi:hypothetical protein